MTPITYLVTAKIGVVIDPLTPTQTHFIAALHRMAQAMAVNVIITCGREGHPLGDPHTRGQALDVHVNDWSVDLIVNALAFLRSTLGSAFTVLFESPIEPADTRLAIIVTLNPKASGMHFHMQPVKSTTWPPVSQGAVV